MSAPVKLKPARLHELRSADSQCEPPWLGFVGHVLAPAIATGSAAMTSPKARSALKTRPRSKRVVISPPISLCGRLLGRSLLQCVVLNSTPCRHEPAGARPPPPSRSQELIRAEAPGMA